MLAVVMKHERDFISQQNLRIHIYYIKYVYGVIFLCVSYNLNDKMMHTNISIFICLFGF